jgi:MFS transporter, DHA1 family, multidrug resistance protein
MDKPPIFLLLAVTFIAQLGVGIITPIIPIYALELGATGLTLGLMVAAFSIARGITQPLVGSYSDRVGRKRFLLIGLIIYSIAAVAYIFAGSIAGLILVRLLHGVGSAMTVPIAMAYMADFSPEGMEGRYMGLLNVAMFSGFGGGPLLGGIVRDLWGTNSAFYTMTLLSLAALVLVLLLLPSAGEGGNTKARTGVFSGLKRMLRSRKISGVLLWRGATMVVMSPTFGFLPILMTDVMDATGVEIGIVIAVRTFVAALLQPFFGRMADRRNKVVMISIACVVVCVLVFFIPSAHTLTQFVILFLMLGTAEAAISPAIGAFAVEGGREYGQGSMMGIFNMVMSIGLLLGSMVAGFLMDLLGLQYSFYGTAVILLMSTGAAAWMITSGQSKIQAENI